MNRSTFIKNIIGLYGVSVLPTQVFTHYTKVYLLQCFVRGFQFYEGPKMLTSIQESGMLELVREPENEYDNYAIALYFNTKKIGFLPAEYNRVLANILDAKLLKLQAEITNVAPNAQAWENLHVAVYALKEISNFEALPPNKECSTLITPTYYSLKTSKNTYAHVYYNEDDVVEDEIDYYQTLIDNSSNDAVYDLIHSNFETGAVFDDVFKNSKIVIKSDVSRQANVNNLLEKVEGCILELDNFFNEKNYVVVNVDELVKIPDKIEEFVEVTDKLGNVFFEVVMRNKAI